MDADEELSSDETEISANGIPSKIFNEKPEWNIIEESLIDIDLMKHHEENRYCFDSFVVTWSSSLEF